MGGVSGNNENVYRIIVDDCGKSRSGVGYSESESPVHVTSDCNLLDTPSGSRRESYLSLAHGKQSHEMRLPGRVCHSLENHVMITNINYMDTNAFRRLVIEKKSKRRDLSQTLSRKVR